MKVVDTTQYTPACVLITKQLILTVPHQWIMKVLITHSAPLRQFTVPHNWTMKVVGYTQYNPGWVQTPRRCTVNKCIGPVPYTAWYLYFQLDTVHSCKLQIK